MYARTRCFHGLLILVAGIAFGMASARSVHAQDETFSTASELMCPNGSTLAANMDRFDELVKQRAKLERALDRADGMVRFTQDLLADHEEGMRVWFIFKASSPNVQAVAAMVDTIHLAARGFQDTAASVDPSPTIALISAGTDVLERLIAVGQQKLTDGKYGKRSSNCDHLPDEANIAIDGAKVVLTAAAPGAKLANGVAGLKNAGVNACKIAENQKAANEILPQNDEGLARLKSDLARYSEAARSLHAQLAGLDSKRLGLEKQCTAFSEQQKKLTDFAKMDSGLSKKIDGVHDDTGSKQRSDANDALGDMMKQIQQAQSDAFELAKQQQLLKQSKPQVVYVATPPAAPVQGASTTASPAQTQAPQCIPRPRRPGPGTEAEGGCY